LKPVGVHDIAKNDKALFVKRLQVGFMENRTIGHDRKCVMKEDGRRRYLFFSQPVPSKRRHNKVDNPGT
jgi:hypothetical protein